MSAVENITKHADALQAEVAKMQEAMSKSETGTAMLQKSQEMASSDEMMELMQLIGDPDFPEEERVTIAKYMGEMLQIDPENGLIQFADYLEELIKDPKYKDRDGYYGIIAKTARDLCETEIYKDYVVKYKAFNDDESDEAVAARKASEDMQKKMKKWSEG